MGFSWQLADGRAGSRARVLRRALALRCPVCGQGGLFRGWFRMVEQCPQCHLVFEREPGHWVGSLGLNTVISFAALLAVLVTGILMTAPDIAVGPLTAAAATTAVVVPLAVFPFSRTLWTAVDLLMRPLEPREIAPPEGSPAAEESSPGQP